MPLSLEGAAALHLNRLRVRAVDFDPAVRDRLIAARQGGSLSHQRHRAASGSSTSRLAPRPFCDTANRFQGLTRGSPREIPAGHGDTQARGSAIKTRQNRFHRALRADRIFRVWSLHHVVGQCQIARRSRQRPDVVEAGDEREGPGAREPAIKWASGRTGRRRRMALGSSWYRTPRRRQTRDIDLVLDSDCNSVKRQVPVPAGVQVRRIGPQGGVVA